ncbi:hypothetical protein C4K12_5361 [Pseudomonas chlororaphis subsp. aureofaciens]|nr:hypothetical protein C4K12_5361 [Pseudomonas chlororaphis subsp. aureofaciens]
MRRFGEDCVLVRSLAVLGSGYRYTVICCPSAALGSCRQALGARRRHPQTQGQQRPQQGEQGAGAHRLFDAGRLRAT